MIIWGAFIIPIGVLVYLLFCYRRELVWWELLVLLAVPALIIAIVKATAEYSQTRDTEYWGGWAVDVRYYEDWDEYIHQTCTRTVSCGKDCTTTQVYDCSYVDYHPEYWELNGSNGENVRIGRERFEFLCNQFGSKNFIDMNRNYYTTDGDMYIGKWDGKTELLEPVTSIHSWENRVQASRSVFKFEEIKDRGALYDYPGLSDGYKQPVVLGNLSVNQSLGVKRMEYWNAVLGARKRVRLYTLIYRNQPMQKALDQQSYWMGGNKNEFNIAVGLDNDDRVQWAQVFSWSDIEGLKVDAKNYIIGQSTFNLVAFADWLGPEINKRWAKKNFHDFDYLSIDPPLWAIILAYVLSVLSSFGVGIWVVNNENREER